MTINTKFELGQEVFTAFKENEFVAVARSTIDEIALKKDGNIVYYLDGLFDECNEDEIVDVNAVDELYNLINKLTKDGETDGRETN